MKKNKTAFLLDNYLLCKVAFSTMPESGSHKIKEAKLLINKARTELGYKKTTVSVDIFNGLWVEYKKIEPDEQGQSSAPDNKLTLSKKQIEYITLQIIAITCDVLVHHLNGTRPDNKEKGTMITAVQEIIEKLNKKLI